MRRMAALRSAVSGDLEGTNRICCRGGANVRLQRFATHHVNGSFEQAGNVGFETGVLPHADGGLGREVDQDVDVGLAIDGFATL
jgi:hypothetical protein